MRFFRFSSSSFNMFYVISRIGWKKEQFQPTSPTQSCPLLVYSIWSVTSRTKSTMTTTILASPVASHRMMLRLRVPVPRQSEDFLAPPSPALSLTSLFDSAAAVTFSTILYPPTPYTHAQIQTLSPLYFRTDVSLFKQPWQPFTTREFFAFFWGEPVRLYCCRRLAN